MPFEWIAPRNALSIASACAVGPVTTARPIDATARTVPTDSDRGDLRARTGLLVMSCTSYGSASGEGRHDVLLPDIQRRHTRLIAITSARTLRIRMMATLPKPAGH